MEYFKRLFLLSLSCFFLAVSAAGANQDEFIGKIKTMKPEASIIRGDMEITADVGTEIHANDKLKTGRDGVIGIFFTDGAMLTLGPGSEFLITEYEFKPLENKTSFLSKMQKGAASYISGAIGRISPEAVKIETPTAYLGLRGTKILISVD